MWPFEIYMRKARQAQHSPVSLLHPPEAPAKAHYQVMGPAASHVLGPSVAGCVSPVHSSSDMQ